MKKWGVRRRGVCGLRRGLGAGRNEAWAWEDFGRGGGSRQGVVPKVLPPPPKKE